METDDGWLEIVCGELGRSSGRTRGVDGCFPSPEVTPEAFTVSALISATTALGAAIPNPLWPRLICLINLGCFAICLGGLGVVGSALFLRLVGDGLSPSVIFIDNFLAEGPSIGAFFSGSEVP